MDLLGAYCSDDSDSERDEAQERGEGVAPGSPGSPAAATSAQHEHGEDRGARVLSGGAGRGREKKKRVVNFLVPSAQLKPLRDDEDYRPKKRQLTDNKSASLFDSLPAPRIELKEFSSHSNNLSSATDKKKKGASMVAAGGKDKEQVQGHKRETEDSHDVRSRRGVLQAAPEVSANPNDMYRVGAGGQYAIDYGAYYDNAMQMQQQEPPGYQVSQSAAAGGGGQGAQRVLELALEEERRRKKKRGGGYESGSSSKMPKVVEVNQSSLVGGIAERSASNPIRDALGDDYEQRLRNQAGNLPGQMARRKHQIGSLLYDSKMAELELLESRAKSVKTKRETQAKYGW